MKRLYALLFFLPFLLMGVLDRGFPSGVAGESMVVHDNFQTGFTDNQCINWASNVGSAFVCTVASTRHFVSRATTVKRISVHLKELPDTNDGCEFEVLIGTNEADAGTPQTLSTRPVFGDQSPGAGFTLMSAVGDTASATLAGVIPAGGWVGVRTQDVAGAGSAVGDCATTPPDTWVEVYE